MAIEGDEAKCSKISQRDGEMINIEAERFFNNHDGGGDGGGDFGYDSLGNALLCRRCRSR